MERTTIIGIDAATQPKKIGLARGHLDGDDLVVTDVVLGSAVTSVAETVASWIGPGPTLLAIDAPLGWPAPLAQGLSGHRAGQVLDGDGHDLFRRVTDRFVHATVGKMPLDVGADRIARTAHMALRLLGEVRARTGFDIPLAWSPNIDGVAAVEVYPAATLRCHKATCTGYKGNDAGPRDYRATILSALRDDWKLEVDDRLLAGCDDLLDAAVCLLAGADFLRGKCIAPGKEQQEAAEVEGWIWIRRR